MQLHTADFNGFRNQEAEVVEIGTILGGAVAIECDVLDAAPVPRIEWFADDQKIASSMIEYVDDGRYLYIQSLTEQQRNAQYHCEVANKYMYLRAIAPTTYTLTGNIGMNYVTVYKALEPIFVSLGETEQTVVVYVAAVPRADGTASVLGISCPTDPNVIIVSNGSVITIQSRFTKSDSVESLDITCVLVGSPITPSPEVHFSFTVIGKLLS